MNRKNGFLQGFARALNAGGSAIVVMYDEGYLLVGKSTHYLKQRTPKLQQVVISTVNSAIHLSRTEKIKNKIMETVKRGVAAMYPSTTKSVNNNILELKQRTINYIKSRRESQNKQVTVSTRDNRIENSAITKSTDHFIASVDGHRSADKPEFGNYNIVLTVGFTLRSNVNDSGRNQTGR